MVIDARFFLRLVRDGGVLVVLYFYGSSIAKETKQRTSLLMRDSGDLSGQIWQPRTGRAMFKTCVPYVSNLRRCNLQACWQRLLRGSDDCLAALVDAQCVVDAVAFRTGDTQIGQ